MGPQQKMVFKFHEKFGQTVGRTIKVRDPVLRSRLVTEESKELCAALISGDIEQTIDGCCDLIYVTLGTAVACGFNVDPFFREVHRTNMEKQPGLLREDGKIMKPPGWSPPNIYAMLNRGTGKIWI